VISSHLLNNNYLLASQSQAAAAVANFTHPCHPLAPFHHQSSPILQNLPLPIAVKSPALTQINSILTSSPTATIPTQIPNYIASAQQQQQQQIKSINTSTSFNSPPATSINSTTQSTIDPTTSVGSNSINTNTPVTTSPTTPNINMDQVGQIGQNPMQSHPLSQSMDSVNTASNEEEVSNHSLSRVVAKEVVMFC
jgi:hypothetical protein